LSAHSRVRRSCSRLFLWLLLLTLVSGCGQAGEPELEWASPASVGMDSAALDAAVHVYRAAVQQDEVRGAVLLVARHGRVVLWEAIGWRDREKEQDLERDDLFHMSSNTKPVIATAVLMLSQRGDIALEDPIQRYLPVFSTGKQANITIHHLLTHTSGFPRQPIFLSPLLENSNLQKEVSRYTTFDLHSKPGSVYSYSNAGYNILGALIEAVSGQPLDVFLRETLYLPLGMTNSANHESLVDQRRMSTVYQRSGDGWVVRWTPGDAPRFPIIRASGGMVSSAWDYAIFLQTWLNGGGYGNNRILSPEVVSRATSPLTKDLESTDDQDAYGHGWRVSPDGVYYHTGAWGTFGWVDPNLGLIGIAFTQSGAEGNPRREFMELVRKAVR
jgi:CubicO group peptidase (beta-lactamase class C family)